MMRTKVPEITQQTAYEKISAYVISHILLGNRVIPEQTGKYYRTHIEEARLAAQNLDFADRERLALEGICILIKRGEIKGAETVMTVFQLKSEDVRSTVVKVSKELLQLEDKRISNLSKVLNAWSAFYMDIDKLGSADRAHIQENALISIELAIDKNRTDLALKGKSAFFKVKSERLKNALLGGMKKKLLRGEAVSIRIMKKKFSMDRSETESLVIECAKVLSREGETKKESRIIRSSGVSRKVRREYEKSKQLSLPF